MYIIGYGLLAVIGGMLVAIIVKEMWSFRRADGQERFAILLAVPSFVCYITVLAAFLQQLGWTHQSVVAPEVMAATLPVAFGYLGNAVGHRIGPKPSKPRQFVFVRLVRVCWTFVLGSLCMAALVVLEIMESFTHQSGWQGIAFKDGYSTFQVVCSAAGGMYVLALCVVQAIKLVKSGYQGYAR